MKSQKEAVVEEVLNVLGSSFVKGKDNALSLLSSSQLELIKINIASGITAGRISYGKLSTSNAAEITAYARSMVMNHLKKAPELNGGAKNTATVASTTVVTNKQNIVKKVNLPSKFNAAIMPQEVIELVNSLVN